MTKPEAIKKFVDRCFSPIPTDWVETVAEARGEDIFPLPMWGTMYFVNSWGERLMEHSRLMVGEAIEIDLKSIKDEYRRNEVETAIKHLNSESISFDCLAMLQEYVDEEMSGAHCILDKDGNTTSAFIYEIDGQYLIGVNGAGWDFYEGVWDKLYDVLGFEWHE